MSIDERLRHLADHIDAELAGDPAARPGRAPVVALARRGSAARRPRLVAAAAAVLVLGGAGVTVAWWNHAAAPASGPAAPPLDGEQTPVPAATGPVPAEQRPLHPTAFPVVEHQIDGASDPQGSYGMIAWDNPRAVEAFIAQVSAATMTGGIDIQAVAGTRADAEQHFSEVGSTHETVQVWGRGADVYTPVHGDPLVPVVALDSEVPGVTLWFSGLDPLAVLSTADEFVHVVEVPDTRDDGLPFTIELGALPDGYQVVTAPTMAANGAVYGTLSVNDLPSVEGNLVQVMTTDPLGGIANAGTMHRVDVNGVEGWMFDGPGHDVIWPVDDVTVATVSGSATADEALSVARAVTFVDEATWRARYDVPEPAFGGRPGPVVTIAATPSIPAS